MPIPPLKIKTQDSWKNQVVKSSFTKNREKNKKNKKNWKTKIVLFVFVLFLFAIISAFIFIAWLSRDLPNPYQLIEREVAQSTTIYDRTGEHILYEIHGDEKRTMINLDDLPDYVKMAPIAIEDKNFYNHSGFSVWAMFRTLVTNVLYNKRAGGSTLTQQFIKNAVLTPEKRITRKLKEIVLAYRLEKKFSKDEILQMYLNEIPYGSNAYGIEAASQKYFNKSAKDISIAEAALLAAITQAPTRYSPYGPNKDLLLGRKDYVLTLMREQGYISESEENFAKDEEIKFAGPETNITAPHFVMYIREMLANKYGEKMIEQEGLKIYTTLDLYKQKIAEEVIKEKTDGYQEKYNASNASLVSIDPKTGQILAMVGSRDYFNNEIDGQVNVSIRPRQPGSSMKPLAYAALFIKGYSPDTILYDVETNFSNDPSNPYTPRNYSGNENGPVSIRKALAGSLNIPAVKALYLAGVNNVIDLAESMGYSTLGQRDRFGLALVLGGAEVRLLEHVNAYSVFARDGKMSPIIGVLKIEDRNGKTIEEYEVVEKTIFEPKVARMINSVLSDNSARAYIFGERNNLTLGSRPVAAKTGTTNDYRDAWTIGYTPSIVTGVWVGNSNNEKMKGVADGSVLAAPIWNSFMSRVLGDTPIESFKEPDKYQSGKSLIDGIIPSEAIKIDISTGEIATSVTPPELISEIEVEKHHSILFYVDKDDPLGPMPEEPEKDPQFLSWEKSVLAWVEKNASSSLRLLENFKEFNNPENTPEIKIIKPIDGIEIKNNKLEIEIEAKAKRGINTIGYFINGNLWKTGGDEKKYINDVLPPLINGYQSLLVRVCDDVNNCSEKDISFNLKINQENYINKPEIIIFYPTNNLSVAESSFPLPINFSIKYSENLARLLFFIESESDNSVNIIANINNYTDDNYEIYLKKPGSPGAYNIYYEARSWNGDVISGEKIKINL